MDTYTFNETNRCLHVRELDNLAPSDKRSYDSIINLILFLKRYHQACRNSDVRCFYDEQLYMCLCDFKHRSALCYKYDFQYDQCEFCLNGGLCIYRNKLKNRFNYVCQCQQCSYGSLCQYRIAQFGYSLWKLY
ncbi:unnamed protein product [Adineta ricciae]|uniref:EGF-like domain-containing protein n=1 Tax=Adineta ricciae TaxID=249248 RepID=A0A815LMM6_ADIRI|nr:unnamed protein product [Adineta ricciae]CAF1406266.1 unnamed protein product [Adineta ricciae]